MGQFDLGALGRAAKKSVKRIIKPHRDLQFELSGPSWLTTNLAQGIPTLAAPGNPIIEDQARKTEEVGARPLWEGYAALDDYTASTTQARSSNDVRTMPQTGNFFSWLAEVRRPDRIVEFGTAFGVSGMYWLSGLEKAGTGHLMTYEPNSDWASFAEQNLLKISNRFTLTHGTFEDNAAATLEPQSVDIGFIDAIHTDEFVTQQWAILKPFMKPGGLVLFDDINFSPSMQACWKKMARMPEAVASAAVVGRVGIVELAA